jgi:hypothetical protein
VVVRHADTYTGEWGPGMGSRMSLKKEFQLYDRFIAANGEPLVQLGSEMTL